MKVIACIEDPDVIQKILTHLQLNTETTASRALPEPRAPPISDLFDTLCVRRQLSCPVRDNYDGRLGVVAFLSFYLQ